MNTSQNFNNDLNIENAFDLSEKNYSHDELLDMLNNGSIAQKQIAALKFDCVNDINDAKALINNLTGCDGKIREAVAYKINQLLTNHPETRVIFAKISAKTFAKATIDINGNICRLVVNSANILKNISQFTQIYLSDILQYTNEALNELDKFIFKDKKYVINKQLFKLYWCLEALIYFYEYVDDKTLEGILTKCATQEEYTIREKCAQIISNSGKFPEIKSKLLNDTNYYVKQAFKSSTHL